MSETNKFRLSEMTFAYERAAGVIESECALAQPAGEDEEGWYDLDTSDDDLTDEVSYLDSRRLLQHHPEHPHWVILLDEGEPLEEVK